MPDPIALADFVADTRRFMSELAQNNDRDWFRGQKARFDAELKRPSEHILSLLAPELEARGGARPRTKLFRPHRDVRFSEDKTPFHTHLHMLWALGDGRGWYFGLSPDYTTAGAGVMGFDEGMLHAYRAAVAGAEGAGLSDILEAIGGRMDPPQLRRVPTGHPPDHVRADLLRRKGLVVWIDGIEDRLAADPAEGLLAVFDTLQPLQDWLGRCVTRHG